MAALIYPQVAPRKFTVSVSMICSHLLEAVEVVGSRCCNLRLLQFVLRKRKNLKNHVNAVFNGVVVQLYSLLLVLLFDR